MPALLPAVLTPTLQLYSQLTQQRLPNFIDAFYIVGSIALGEFNEHFSDVDFIAVTHQRATENDIETLRSIHQDDGVLKMQDNYEMNPVTWWILKKRGVAVWGMEAERLPFELEGNRLIPWTQANMNSYWASWTYRPDGWLTLLTDWGVQWVVLGILRQFYTFHENAITTKQRAGEYGLEKIPARWHTLIREALRIRTKAARRSYYLFRIVRTIAAIRFLKYIIAASNAYLAELSTKPQQPLEVD